jgi:hypothetical protein
VQPGVMCTIATCYNLGNDHGERFMWRLATQILNLERLNNIYVSKLCDEADRTYPVKLETDKLLQTS